MRNFKRILTFSIFMVLLFGGTLLYSPIGWNVRVKLAEVVLVTRYQHYAWIFVGKSKRDQMIQDQQIVQHCGNLPDKNHLCM
jgi:hypothetical protein